MPTYICNNKKCSRYGEHSFVERSKIVIRNNEVKDLMADCPECKLTRRTKKDDGFTTMIHGNNGNIPL